MMLHRKCIIQYTVQMSGEYQYYILLTNNFSMHMMTWSLAEVRKILLHDCDKNNPRVISAM